MEVNPRPIPPPQADDNEDVHWALSTSHTLWGRGEYEDALRWLRRAAEQASDANADDRALELFKAAADVANQLAAVTAKQPTAPPPAAEPRLQVMAAPEVAEVNRPVMAPSRPPPPPPTRSAPPPPPVRVSKHPDAQRAAPVAAPQAVQARTVSPSEAPPRPTAQPVAPRTVAQQPAARPQSETDPQRTVRSAGQTADKPSGRRGRTATVQPGRGQSKAKSLSRATSIGMGPAIPLASDAHGADVANRKRAETVDDMAVTADRRAAPTQSAGDRKRVMHEEEVTKQRDLSVLRQDFASIRVDDLDEDTRVFEGKPTKRASKSSSAAVQVSATPQSMPHAGQLEPVHWSQETVADIGQQPMRVAATGLSDVSTASENSSWTHDPTRLHESQMAKKSSKSLETLAAIKVAVLATSVVGEVRLVALDEKSEPPTGAAVAILVPLSSEDGAAIGRLFREG